MEIIIKFIFGASVVALVVALAIGIFALVGYITDQIARFLYKKYKNDFIDFFILERKYIPRGFLMIGMIGGLVSLPFLLFKVGDILYSSIL